VIETRQAEVAAMQESADRTPVREVVLQALSEALQMSARREVREQVQQRPARGLWRAVRLSERLRPPEVQHAE
jgi:hypothetical protein